MTTVQNIPLMGSNVFLHHYSRDYGGDSYGGGGDSSYGGGSYGGSDSYGGSASYGGARNTSSYGGNGY